MLLLRRLLSLGATARPPTPQMATSDYPSGPSAPVAFPVKDLEYLESRSYFSSFHYPFNVASVPLPPHAVPQPQRPRLLVCHDMAGGYGDDRWVQGGSNPDAYSIWHWNLIDVFVYFSHGMVTLPPPCWTNAAHRHGVKVLGTFILEWGEGQLKANELLLTQKSAQLYAERLAELSKALHFDGWLLNMEVELKADQIPILKEFVNHLTHCMHSDVPGSLVIWYDSVTKDGKLNWQNQLNEKNKVFFDLCDGIFTNYSWQEDYPRKSAVFSVDRRFDVYMGIDVFGRNTYGGGQWNTNAALDVLKKNGVSAALFAPGWVYENKEPPNFETAQNRWWGLVEKSWEVPRPSSKKLPFFANFNQGQGYHFSVEGLQVTEKPWNNLSCQHIQPSYDSYTGPDGTPMAIFIESKGASYSGGGNLTFRGNLAPKEIFTTSIFAVDISLEGPINISFSVRSDGNSLLGLSFLFLSQTDGRASILVAENGNSIPEHEFNLVVSPSWSTSNLDEGGWIVYETDIQKSGCILTEIHAVCCLKEVQGNEENVLHLQGRKFLSGNPISDSLLPFHASLGHLAIQYRCQKSNFPSANKWLFELQDATWSSGSGGVKSLLVNLVWKLVEGLDSSFESYNIYVEKLPKNKENDEYILGGLRKFIGVTKLNMFLVSNLEVNPDTRVLRFVIQPCAFDGFCQKIDECPVHEMEVED